MYLKQLINNPLDCIYPMYKSQTLPRKLSSQAKGKL